MKTAGTVLALALVLTPCAGAAPAAKGPVLVALEQGVARSFRVLKEKGDPAPYFLSYLVTETEEDNDVNSYPLSPSEHLFVGRVQFPEISSYRAVRAYLSFDTQALQAALDDLAPSEVAGNTAHCEHIVVFGSNRISQLASTVNAMLVFVAPLSLAMLLLAFLLSLVAYIVII